MLQLVAVMMLIVIGWLCLPTDKCAFEHATILESSASSYVEAQPPRGTCQRF